MAKPLDQTRNLHPHKEARLAMIVWGEEYARQMGGSMDFYDSLSDSRKEDLAKWLDEIEKAHHAAGGHP